MYGFEHINRNKSYYHYQIQTEFYLYTEIGEGEININKYSLLCTINKLELIRSSVTFLNTLIIPKSLHMVIIFLQLKNNDIFNPNNKHQLNMIKPSCAISHINLKPKSNISDYVSIASLSDDGKRFL
jgi:hypothetical protein